MQATESQSQPPAPLDGAAPPAPASSTPPAAAPAVSSATRPAYLPEQYWDSSKNEVKAPDLQKHFETLAARQADLVTDPAKFDLKSSIKGQDGSDIQFNLDDPLMKGVLGLAKDRGLTKQDVQALGDVVITAEKAAVEAEYKEFLKIGGGDEAKANQRMNAVLAKGAALLGAEGKETPESKKAMGSLIAVISLSSQFEALEKLLNSVAPGSAEAGGGSAVDKNIATRWYPKEVAKAG